MGGAAKAPSAQPFHPPPPCAGHLGFNEPGNGRQAIGLVVHQDGGSRGSRPAGSSPMRLRSCGRRTATFIAGRLQGTWCLEGRCNGSGWPVTCYDSIRRSRAPWNRQTPPQVVLPRSRSADTHRKSLGTTRLASRGVRPRLSCSPRRSRNWPDPQYCEAHCEVDPKNWTVE
jgi:hypothetical protein